MTAAMHEETSRVFYDLGMDHSIDVVILTGAGKAFSAGGDIAGMREMYEESEPCSTPRHQRSRKSLAFSIATKFIICKMDGDAVGLGATIGLFCDVIFAADHARIGDPHVSRQALPPAMVVQIIWPQLIGYARAKEYLLTGDLINGQGCGSDGPHQLRGAGRETERKGRCLCPRITARSAMKSIPSTPRTAINIGLQSPRPFNDGHLHGLRGADEPHRRSPRGDRSLQREAPVFVSPAIEARGAGPGHGPSQQPGG